MVALGAEVPSVVRAGCAGEAERERAARGRRAPADGRGRAEERHHRRPDRGGEVDRPGVAGDEELHPRQCRRERVDRERRQVGGHRRPQARAHRVERLAVARAARQDEAHALAGERVGHLGEALRRPPLGGPARAGRDGDDRPADAAERVGGQRARPGGEMDARPSGRRHAERRQRLGVELGGMGTHERPVGADEGQQRPPEAAPVEGEAPRCRRAADESAPHLVLQVDHEVELPPQSISQGHGRPGRGTIEDVYRRQAGEALQERRVERVRHPLDVRSRVPLQERIEDARGEHHVAERAVAEDEELHRGARAHRSTSAGAGPAPSWTRERGRRRSM